MSTAPNRRGSGVRFIGAMIAAMGIASSHNAPMIISPSEQVKIPVTPRLRPELIHHSHVSPRALARFRASIGQPRRKKNKFHCARLAKVKRRKG